MGAGRPFKMDLRDRCIILLVYYRLYITYTLAGFLFDLDQSNICRDIQKIESLVRQCLPIPQKIYNITKRLKTPEEVELYFPGVLSFIDCIEQQIPRPVDNKRRRIYYSGKKKRHTVKNQIMVNNRGFIIHKANHHKKGKRHDYNIYKKNHSVTPKQVIQKLVDWIDSMLPSKGITASLEAILNNVLKQLNNNNNEVAACKSLDVFLNQIEAKETNKQITSTICGFETTIHRYTTCTWMFVFIIIKIINWFTRFYII